MRRIRDKRFLAAKREELRAFVAAHVAEHGRSPTYREMGLALGMSLTWCHKAVAEMAASGRVRKDPGRWCSVQVVA